MQAESQQSGTDRSVKCEQSRVILGEDIWVRECVVILESAITLGGFRDFENFENFLECAITGKFSTNLKFVLKAL